MTGWKNEDGREGVNPSPAYSTDPSGIQGQSGASERIFSYNEHLFQIFLKMIQKFSLDIGSMTERWNPPRAQQSFRSYRSIKLTRVDLIPILKIVNQNLQERRDKRARIFREAFLNVRGQKVSAFSKQPSKAENTTKGSRKAIAA